MKRIIVAIFFLIGSIWCQQNWDNSVILLLKEQCSSREQHATFVEFEDAVNTLKEFVKTEINPSEFKEAMETGKVGSFFAKACSKEQVVMNRLEDIIRIGKKCFPPSDNKSVDEFLRVLQRFTEFLCENGGDKMTRFLTNGGVECVASKSAALQECANKAKILVASDDKETPSPSEIEEKLCKAYSTTEICIVSALKECPNPTAANLIGELLAFIWQNMECNNAYTIASSIPLIITSLFILWTQRMI